MKINLDLEDLTNSALKRLVKQLLMTPDGQEKKVLDRLSRKNDLADLDEEMHGKPNTPEVEDDEDPFDLNGEAADEAQPKKKGKK